ncbi:uncharacterized protein Bfra_002637 [Botrytis fragariae]|uniref:Uncharacterized protein n=1 Tax=Botrytis fragariae TaxID=1964551 RepID=A0A8H6AZD9_9HELO|nr:uncharacterized protein Bfra_002637 [Botrytis fragariae]KAF5876235.1 hypothetical protein Bfra_002637 [Botrytis fragariae]
MKPYDPQSQSLQPLLSTIIRRLSSFQIDLRNSESGEEIRKSAWRLERGEKQLHSTPRVPIKVSYLVIGLFSKTLTHNDELLYVMVLRGLSSIVQLFVIDIRGPLKRGGEKEPQFGYPTKDHRIGVLQIPAKAQRSLDSGNLPFNREENRIARKQARISSVA